MQRALSFEKALAQQEVLDQVGTVPLRNVQRTSVRIPRAVSATLGHKCECRKLCDSRYVYGVS